MAHFSTHRPIGKLVYSVEMPTYDESVGNTLPAREEVSEAETEEESEQVQQDVPAPMVDPEHCERAQASVFALENKPQVRLETPDGEYRVLDGEERAALLRRNREFIETYCE